MNVMRLEKRTGRVAKNDGLHTIVSEIPVSARVPRQHRDLFEKRQHSHGPFTIRIDTSSDAEVTLKLKNSSSFAEKVSYLGLVKRPKRLVLSNATAAPVREVKERTTQRELRSTLDLCNVFSRLVSNFSKLSSQLNKKLRTNQPTSFLSHT